jgi:hypothetical protein
MFKIEFTRAQPVSRRLPSMAARIQSQVRSCGIWGGQSGTGANFIFRILWIPVTILIPSPASRSLLILSLTLYGIDTESIVK